MILRAVCLSALVYTALGALASPAPAQALDAEARAGLEALRTGDMRKLVVHETPVAVPDVAYVGEDGAETTLQASDGALRLVNFWATWCAPCREEMPALQTLARDLGPEGLELILIATGRNSPEAIAAFFEEEDLELETALDPRSRLAQAMAVPGLPVTVILDREGREVARLMGGADWAGESARAILGDLLAR